MEISIARGISIHNNKVKAHPGDYNPNTLFQLVRRAVTTDLHVSEKKGIGMIVN